MFSVLNRLRGTWGFMAKISSIAIGIIFYFATNDIYVSVSTSIMYIVGESMGWGKWIGGIKSNHKLPATKDMIEDIEGRNNGIHYIANIIVKEKDNYYLYCWTALAIRGAYWFGATTLPLLIFGYLSFFEYATITLLLAIGFPVSVMIGILTTKIFNFKLMENYWEHSEVWYGLIQDIMIVIALLLIRN